MNPLETTVQALARELRWATEQYPRMPRAVRREWWREELERLHRAADKAGIPWQVVVAATGETRGDTA